MKRTFAVFACMALFFAAAPLGAVSLTDADKAKVDEIAAAWVEAGKSAGLVIGVAADGEMLHAKGYGFADLEHQVPMADDAILLVGSITKQFTTVAVLQLVEQGRLSLEDPVSKYFPDFPRGSEVTVRRLLDHTSGIASYTDYDISREEKWVRPYTTADMVEHIARYQPPYDFPVGTAWNYTNSGFFLAGAIVEQITGQPLRAYLQEHVIGKAGLTDTALADDEREVVPRRADGYDALEGEPGSYQRADFIDMSVPGGAGAMHSTVRDLAKWHQALLAGEVVSPAMVTEMLTPATLKDGRSVSERIWRPDGDESVGEAEEQRPVYALGISVGELNGHKLISHGGGIQGFNASFVTFPDDHLTVVVLANTSGGAGDLWREIALSILEAQAP